MTFLISECLFVGYLGRISHDLDTKEPLLSLRPVHLSNITAFRTLNLEVSPAIIIHGKINYNGKILFSSFQLFSETDKSESELRIAGTKSITVDIWKE